MAQGGDEVCSAVGNYYFNSSAEELRDNNAKLKYCLFQVPRYKLQEAGPV